MEKKMYTGTYTVVDGENEKEITFNYKKELSSIERISFVNSIAETVINGTDYYPTLEGVMFGFELVRSFTDIDTSNIVTIDEIDDFLEVNDNLIRTLFEVIDEKLIKGLMESTRKVIDHRLAIYESPLANSLDKLINTLETKLNEINVNDFMGFAKKLSDVPNELTAEKMLEAYANTDIFKKKFREVSKEDNEGK